MMSEYEEATNAKAASSLWTDWCISTVELEVRVADKNGDNTRVINGHSASPVQVGVKALIVVMIILIICTLMEMGFNLVLYH